MASIRRRGEKWQVQVRRRGFEASTKSFSQKADAQKWAKSIEREIEVSAFRPQERPIGKSRFSDLISRYKEEVTPKKRSRYQEEGRISRILKHPIAQEFVSHLTTRQFALYRDERLLFVGPQTVRHDLNLMNHIIKVAMSEWDVPIVKNPVSDLRKPIPPAGRKRRLNNGELERIRTASLGCRSAYLWPIIEFALETAMRRGEILNLSWSNIDFDRGLAVLPLTKNGSARTVPLSAKAKAVLKGIGLRRQGRVFVVGNAALRLAWDRMLVRAEIVDLHFHDLRHEAISRLFEKRLTIAEVALISGHKDVRMLFRYTHLRAEDLVMKLDG